MTDKSGDLGGATPVAFVQVGDRQRALAFYREVRELELRSTDDFGDFLHFGGGLLRMTVLPGFQPQPHPVLGWNVADIRSAVEALRRRGVEFALYEGMGQDELAIWTSPDGASKVAFFTDSEGNLLSLSQA